MERGDPCRTTGSGWQALDKYKAYKNWTTHAAGLIITDDEQTIADIPQLNVTGKDYMVSAFDKDDVERLGLVKLDLLNLKLLTAIRVMQQVSGIKHKDVPAGDSRVFTHLNRGNVTGIFQLEGGSTRSGLRRLRPKKIEDLVAAVALFRPATIDSGATEDFLRRRANEVPIPKRHSLIEEGDQGDLRHPALPGAGHRDLPVSGHDHRRDRASPRRHQGQQRRHP